MDDKKDENLGGVPVPERRNSAVEQPANLNVEKTISPEGGVEKGNVFHEDENISEGLKREIELMQLDDGLKKQAEEKANKIHSLADEDKLKELLKIAQEKGVVYAIQVCKKMNDPYLLDTLHDLLAREGYYQNFIKK